MRKRLFLMFAICCIFLSMFSTAAVAASPLDEIQNYTIQVDMRTDGTMDITYHVVWKVLDDTSEGALSWVKIGNPNKYVDQIKALSSNIKNIRYDDDGGSYIRIDFNEEYKKDEIITFEYRIHQSHMYIIEEESHLCRYSFTPGWFDEIRVKEIKILWNSVNVIESNSQTKEGNYLVWKDSLEFGERLNASVKYNLDVFTTNEDEQYTEESENDGSMWIIIVIIIVIVVLGIIVFAVSDDDDYDSHGGFRSGHTTYIHTSSCVRSSCACASCACACACAGGGRAGCSKKDFYGTNLQTEDLKKTLKK